MPIDDRRQFRLFFFGPFIATSASAVGTTSRNIPGYDFVLSGKEVGLPSYPDSVWGTNDKVVQVADVQIWVDQFIDPTDHISKFMKPDVDDPAKPRLVDPSVAETAFGKPTFFFDGPPSKFATNRGSGGEFTKVGDLKKFIPYPPKAPAPTP